MGLKESCYCFLQVGRVGMHALQWSEGLPKKKKSWFWESLIVLKKTDNVLMQVLIPLQELDATLSLVGASGNDLSCEQFWVTCNLLCL